MANQPEKGGPVRKPQINHLVGCNFFSTHNLLLLIIEYLETVCIKCAEKGPLIRLSDILSSPKAS